MIDIKQIVASAALVALTIFAPYSTAGDTISSRQPKTSSGQPDPESLLSAMATFLAEQQSYEVDAHAGFDVLQEDGRKIQFLEARNILLARPNYLRITDTGADDLGTTLAFDGEWITTYSPQEKLYARAPQPGTIDHATLYFIRDLEMRIPLAVMFTTWFPRELMSRTQSIDYVERASVFGKPAHHLAARMEGINFQVWIAEGERPLPLRVVITYQEAGQPQYWAQFVDWNFSPEWSPESFALDLPPDARQIPFAVQFGPAQTSAPPPDHSPEGRNQQ